jgi:hypothetical protein
VTKTEALKLIADYGRAVSQTCFAKHGRQELSIKRENKLVRQLLKALGVTEEITDEEIENA